MSGSNCSFLTYLQAFQEAGKVVRCSHILKNFPQFVVIHTVKSFSAVNEAEVDVFLEFSWFSSDPTDIGNLMSGSNCCFLACIQASQEAGKVIWYSHLKEFSTVCYEPHS